jgi:hypothetical protein
MSRQQVRHRLIGADQRPHDRIDRIDAATLEHGRDRPVGHRIAQLSHAIERRVRPSRASVGARHVRSLSDFALFARAYVSVK